MMDWTQENRSNQTRPTGDNIMPVAGGYAEVEFPKYNDKGKLLTAGSFQRVETAPIMVENPKSRELPMGLYWAFVRGIGWMLARNDPGHKLPWMILNDGWHKFGEFDKGPFPDRTVDIYIAAAVRLHQPQHPREVFGPFDKEKTPTGAEMDAAREAAIAE